MKKLFRITIVIFSMLVLFSCNYDTHVLNIVHRDGSVTRKITIENSQEYFEPKKFRVPVDSTWQTEITYDVRPNHDTIWYLTAEKHFNNVREINDGYKYDMGSNRGMHRSARFSKKFRWFTTEFRYSETVERALNIDCPLSDFLSEDEMKYVNLPGKIQDNLKNGPDSTKYKTIDDLVSTKMGKWFYTCEMRQWIDIFQGLFGNDPALKNSRETMESREPLFVDYLMAHDEVINQLFEESPIPDSLFISVLGTDFFHSFSDDITYSLSILREMSRPVWYCDNYDLEIQMPGKIFASNGYTETDSENGSGGGILFTVGPEHFLTQNYECWVSSRVNNYYIWAITGFFVLIVVSGLIRPYIKKND